MSKETHGSWHRFLHGICHVSAFLFIILLSFDLFVQCQYYPELGYDESASFLGKQLLHGKYGNTIDPRGPGFTRYFRMDCYPPVYYLFSALVFKLLGFGLVQARLVSILFLMGTMFLCYFIGTKFLNPFAGLCSLLAYFIVPMKVYTVHARPDVAVPFFLGISIAACLEADHAKKEWIWLLAGASYAMAIFSHFVGLMLAPSFAILLWYLWGWKIWKKKSFYYYLAGFLLITALYIVMMYPYLNATIKHLVFYQRHISEGMVVEGDWYADISIHRHVSEGLDSQWNIMEQWPIKSFRMHYGYLKAVFPFLLYSFWGSTLLLLWALISYRRNKINRNLLLFVYLFWSAFLLLSLYPNIGFSAGYYSPCYWIFWSLMIGFLLGLAWDKIFFLRIPLLVIALVMGGMFCNTFHKKVQFRIVDLMNNIPLSSSLQWIREFYDKAYPTLASSHWIYAVPNDELITSRILTFDENKRVILNPFFRSVTQFPYSSSDYKIIIADQYNEMRGINVLKMIHRYPFFDLVSRYFTLVGIMIDSHRITCNYSIFKRSDLAKNNHSWPRIAMTSDHGPVEYAVHEKLVRSIPYNLTLEQLVDNVWGVEFYLSIPKYIHKRPVLCRFITEDGHDDKVQFTHGFVMFNSDISRHQTSIAGLFQNGYVYVNQDDAIGVLGYPYQNGERGRDLLISVKTNMQSALSLYSFRPAILKRIDFVVPIKIEENVSSEFVTALDSLVNSVQQKSIPFVIDISKKIKRGESAQIRLSQVCHSIRIVVWQDGKILQEYKFFNGNQFTFDLKARGKYGIEVWLRKNEKDQESVSAYQITVE